MTDPRKHVVEVKTDAESTWDNETERLAFSVLDTVWNLLNEYAVRITLQELRELAEAEGEVDFPSDEQMFAKLAGVEGAPQSYADLYPGSQGDRFAINGLFAGLVIQAGLEADAGINDANFEDIVAGILETDSEIFKELDDK